MRLCVFLITNSIVKFCDYFFQHILCCYSTDLLRRYARDLISIHPMLLFNRLLIKQLIKNFYFNTSHVIIQHVEVLFDQYFLLISIHPMLLFNFILLPFFHKLDIFQYILCYYSTNEKPSFLHLTDLYKSRF